MSYIFRSISSSISLSFTILILTLINAQSSTAAEQVILGSPTDTSIEMSILFDSGITQYWVEYDTISDEYEEYGERHPEVGVLYVNEFASGLTECTFTTLSDLAPNSRYYYRVGHIETDGSVESSVSEYTFSTQADVDVSFSFVIEADPHTDPRLKRFPDKATWNTDVPEYYGDDGITPFDVDNDPEIWRTSLNDMINPKYGEIPAFLIDLGDTFMLNKVLTNSPEYIPETSTVVKWDIDGKGDGFTQEDVRYSYSYSREIFSTAGHSLPIFLATGNHESEMLKVTSSSKNEELNYLHSDEWSVIARRANFINPVPQDFSFYTGSSETDDVQNLKAELKNVDYISDEDRDRYTHQYRDTWYEWKWGNSQFIVLDPYWYDSGYSNDPYPFSLGRQQYDWLKALLEENNQDIKFKFVFTHHLIGGSKLEAGRGGIEYAKYYEWGGLGEYIESKWNKQNFEDEEFPMDAEVAFLEKEFPSGETASETFNDIRTGWGDPIHKMLVDGKVTAVFTGHDHVFVHQVLDDIHYIQMPQPSSPNYCSGEKLAEDFAYNTESSVTDSGADKLIASSPGFMRVDITKSTAEFKLIRTVDPYDYDIQIKDSESRRGSKDPSCPDVRDSFIDWEASFTIHGDYEKGDVNKDHVLDLVDVIVPLQIMSSIEPSDDVYSTDDVILDDGNERIGLEEAIYVLEELANPSAD